VKEDDQTRGLPGVRRDGRGQWTGRDEITKRLSQSGDRESAGRNFSQRRDKLPGVHQIAAGLAAARN